MINLKKNNIKKLIINIAIPLLLGILVSLITKNSMKQFDLLNKPSFAPPRYLFPIVWTILYILMGISSYLITNKDSKQVYYFSLFFNILWTIIFFSLKLRLIAFLWLIILIILVIKTIILYYKENKIASYLQVPYLLWLFFASYLNLAIYLLN